MPQSPLELEGRLLFVVELAEEEELYLIGGTHLCTHQSIVEIPFTYLQDSNLPHGLVRFGWPPSLFFMLQLQKFADESAEEAVFVEQEECSFPL